MMDIGPFTLRVTVNEDYKVVVFNPELAATGYDHYLLSPSNARWLAWQLIQKADEADRACIRKAETTPLSCNP